MINIMRSKLLNITIKNLGCIGEEGLTVDLDNILCLVGQNNSGKSTILRAYELAVGTQSYSFDKDYCKRSTEKTSVEISVHIPDGIGNIAEKWKEKVGDLSIVKSKWEWEFNGLKTRKTYDPEIQDFADEGNAAGLDNVFNSRLPIPFRIGALDSSNSELKHLLKLIVDPIAESLKEKLDDENSELSKALEVFSTEAKIPVQEHKAKIESYNEEITKSHNKIFPNLIIDLNIGMSEIKVDPIQALINGSKLNIKEFGDNVDWDQQGTGSQRALFWSLLQVRSRLQSMNNIKVEKEKKSKALEKEIKKLEVDKQKAKTEPTIKAKQISIDEKTAELSKLIRGEILDDENNSEDVALPGYMLLIDEPEIALHPNGIRAASKYLYDLAKDVSWQVMLTTHSPLFINPFEDHTTIVRLSRNEGSPSPRTYKSDNIKFEDKEIDELKLLNNFDQNLSEMFFGQYPIIIEGDTEFASFERIMQIETEKYPLVLRPIFIRARGKFTIVPIIKMLQHFKVNFSVLHDSDYPKNKNGHVNGVWTGNQNIYKQIQEARKEGLKVIHRISISTFELEHLGVYFDENQNILLPPSKSKPWIMYNEIKENINVKKSVEKIFDELLNSESSEEPFDNDFIISLEFFFNDWVKKNKIKDSRFKIK